MKNCKALSVYFYTSQWKKSYYLKLICNLQMTEMIPRIDHTKALAVIPPSLSLHLTEKNDHGWISDSK